MKLFKNEKTEKVSTQQKIEELEISLGILPIVTEENFEREFDRAVISDYREKHGKKYMEVSRRIRSGYRSYSREDYKKNAPLYKQEHLEVKAYKEALEFLMLESSKEAFAEEFDPNHDSNYTRYI
ncbi:hypothetical protein SEA_BEUFFERT_256 [Streptomyces phage Beuffert]|nr:hypothetical protein SEA_BEUFFERT_256 [Streptomyces phage Beuffert]